MNPLRVLYVEDDPVDADLTAAWLKANAPDFMLDVVRTGQACLKRLDEGAACDVLLLDNHLPDMDGVDLLKELAGRPVPLPVVMTTSVGDESLVVQVLRLGASDYIPKSGDYLERLPGVLRSAVSGFRELRQQRRVRGGARRRVVYAEHDPADVDLTCRHLSDVAPHLQVELASSSGDALERAAAGLADLVLADLRMPDMSAIELLREARYRRIAVPFVIVTGRGDETAAAAALTLGAYDYIVKRHGYLDQLPYAIDNALARFELEAANHRLEEELQERRRLQQSAADSLALLDAIQKHAPVGIAFMDREFRFQRVNEELASINGVPAEQLVGRTISEMMPQLWPTLAPIYERVLTGEALHDVQISTTTPARPGVERHFLCSFYPVRPTNESVAGIGVAVMEVTERKRAEDVMREHAAALADAARQKDEFLAMLGHELRNPLAPIRTALELVRRAEHQDALTANAYDVMERQIAHMVRLLDDLLDVARITSGRITLETQAVDLRRVAADAIDSVRGLVQARRHSLETAITSEPLLVLGDTTRLVQVLVNLLNNAAKYTGEGGTIRLTLTSAEGQAELRVSDTGTGISPHLLPRIFDLFTQDERALDRAEGGLGLGLTLVRRITELHGGTVRAHSPGRGQGSEFVVTLPLLAVKEHSPREEESVEPPRPEHLRCLVVEDNVDAARMLECALTLEGHDVRLAYDGRDALAAAAAFAPDAVVLDLGLPRMNGYETARALRALPDLADVLIVALTGYGQAEDFEKTRAAGFDAHLVKPVEIDVLLHALAAGRVSKGPP